MNIKSIKQLQLNSSFTLNAVISRFSQRKDKNNNTFWDLTLSDSTGELTCKVWSKATVRSSQNNENTPIELDMENPNVKLEGAPVSVNGKVAQFSGNLQYNINELTFLNQNNINTEEITKHSNIPEEVLKDKFQNLILSIKNEELLNFVDKFFSSDIYDKFIISPAGVRIHHAYKGGLLEHSVSVASLGLEMSEHYKDYGIPVNADLVIAGGLLHDVGKIYTYTCDNIPIMNLEGNLLNHIVLGYQKVIEAAERYNLNHEFTLALGHIILSHHGKLEFGSPVPPQMPEAMIVSAADDIDFKLNYWKNQVESLPPQSDFTDFLPLVERRFWKGISLNS